ncbi:hypothetical protein [Aeromicrobium sp. PE09-221]|uniref:hypothetical protein n=1 Tax=Aeromicrobium sp. PE09-221 TaxID=1898043 RepID=UPI0011220571|nr:hypothetical protein [Aeromicrobium sp. PE09-221]
MSPGPAPRRPWSEPSRCVCGARGILHFDDSHVARGDLPPRDEASFFDCLDGGLWTISRRAPHRPRFL